MSLTHLDENQRPKMVDVSDKNQTTRVAVASGIIEMSQDAFTNIVSQSNKKGPVLQTAVIAAIMGVKQTSTLIPMCHPLNLSGINCDIDELPELLRRIDDYDKISGVYVVTRLAMQLLSLVFLQIQY